MRTVIVIPARLAATRLPGKPLLAIGDKPLVVRTAEQAKRCRGVDAIVIATDSTEIADAARSHSIEVVRTRADHPSGTDRVAEAAQALDASWIVNLQGDEPFVDPFDLEAVVEGLKGHTSELATLALPIESRTDFESPHVVKVVCRDDGHALYFSRAAIPHAREPSGSLAGLRRHVGVYGYRRDALLALSAAPAHPLERLEGLEQLRALALGMRILVLDARTPTRGIDTPDDLAWARARYETLGEAAFPRGAC